MYRVKRPLHDQYLCAIIDIVQCYCVPDTYIMYIAQLLNEDCACLKLIGQY